MTTAGSERIRDEALIGRNHASGALTRSVPSPGSVDKPSRVHLVARAEGETRPSIGFVSTYTPTECGIATFTAALRGAMAAERSTAEGLDVVSLVDTRIENPAPEVVFQHVTGDPESLRTAAQVLNQSDIAVIQHEFGIYGGIDGIEVLDLVTMLKVPSIVIMHTAPRSPSPKQQLILETLVREARATIVLSQSARGQLLRTCTVDSSKVSIIPHGARADLTPHVQADARPLILTWGLISPGKGLETAIEAVAGLRFIRPQPRYLIVGETHPKVRAANGDSYVRGLKGRARRLGLDDLITFDNRYVDLESLHATIRKADLVLLPYHSTEQVTSGVLVEAVAAGKPVVATDFPHAVELLRTGAGIIVPHADPAAMTRALQRAITEPGALAAMGRAARSIGAELDWTRVASRYEAVIDDLVANSDVVVDLTDSRTALVSRSLSQVM